MRTFKITKQIKKKVVNEYHVSADCMHTIFLRFSILFGNSAIKIQAKYFGSGSGCSTINRQGIELGDALRKDCVSKLEFYCWDSLYTIEEIKPIDLLKFESELMLAEPIATAQRLFDAIASCSHNLWRDGEGRVGCEKCDGWFCF